MFLLILSNLTVVLGFLTLQHKINLHSLRNRLEKLAKCSFFYLFLKLLQINFIFSDNVRILHIYVGFISDICTDDIQINHFTSDNTDVRIRTSIRIINIVCFLVCKRLSGTCPLIFRNIDSKSKK